MFMLSRCFRLVLPCFTMVLALAAVGCPSSSTETPVSEEHASIPKQDCGNAVSPTRETIEDGSYRPLSRPLFIYVNKAALNRPEVVALVKFTLNEGQELVGEVGYVKVAEADSAAARSAFDEAVKAAAPPETEKLSGTVIVDGSSTVFPIMQAVAEEFQTVHPEVQVPVGTSGTGGGFKKFVLGETVISNASRPIKPEEQEKCKANGIDYLELKVAIDGLTVVVHPENTWCDCLTVAQLHQIWAPDSTLKTWKEVNPDWPDEEIKLYGADKESGTFDYFTEAVNGKEGATRPDYTPSTDDNVLVIGVSGDKYSLGYFGFAYFVENQDKLKALAISQD